MSYQCSDQCVDVADLAFYMYCFVYVYLQCVCGWTEVGMLGVD